MDLVAMAGTGDDFEVLLASALLAPVAYLLALLTLTLSLHPRGKRAAVFLLGIGLVGGHVPILYLFLDSLSLVGRAFLAGPLILALAAMGLSLLVPRRAFPDRSVLRRVDDVGRLWADQVRRQRPFVRAT